MAPTLPVDDVPDIEPHVRESSVPDRIGVYKILQSLGEGGMGEVYLAEQSEPVKRRVALKLVKLGMDTKQIVARFEAERQALAVMDHPYIARVYDAGATETGRPYFAMELVSGVPLTDYCDTHKLSTYDRVQLFIGVCEAVQHAHQKGVIHRDLKPSNVLVAVQEGGPIPKIIDFGIAKAMGQSLTDQTVVTVHGIPIGTPAYMSPEQAEMSGLDVDTRTDIYSLGVMLYELLAGVLPFDSEKYRSDFITFQLHLRETDPPKPSTRVNELGDGLAAIAEHRQVSPASLRSQLKGDVDWIIMKAMAKDRTRRYETVQGLINDLRRHLRHEPVNARPPTATYRISKFIRRHKVAVATAVVVMASLGIGLVVATYQRSQAVAAQARAVRNLNLAIEAVDEMLMRVGDTLSAMPQTEELRGELLNRARRFYEQFEEQTTDPELTLGTALAHQRLGDVYRFLGQKDEAERSYERSIGRLTELTRDFPSRPHYQRHLADSYNWLGLQLASDQPERAMDAYRTALDLQRELVSRDPDEPAYKHYLARTLYNRGILLSSDTARLDDSERDYRAAIDQLESLVDGERGFSPATRDYRHELARCYNNLGNLLRGAGRDTEASASYRRAIEILEELRGKDADRRAYKKELAIYYNNLANMLLDNGELESAEENNRRAVALFEDLAAPLPSLDLERANSYSTLGLVMWDRNRVTEAEDALRHSVEIWERLAASSGSLASEPVFHYRFGFTLFDLASLRLNAEDFAQAGRYLARAAEQHLAVLESVERDNAMFDLCMEYQDLDDRLPNASKRALGSRASGALAEVLNRCESV